MKCTVWVEWHESTVWVEWHEEEYSMGGGLYSTTVGSRIQWVVLSIVHYGDWCGVRV